MRERVEEREFVMTKIHTTENGLDMLTDQGADSRQAASMPKADRTGTTFHAGVKGEFVGKYVPPDGTGWKMQRTGSLRNRPRSVPTDWEDRNVNMPKSHISINMT